MESVNNEDQLYVVGGEGEEELKEEDRLKLDHECPRKPSFIPWTLRHQEGLKPGSHMCVSGVC